MAHAEVPAEQAHVDEAYRRLESMRAAAERTLHEAFGERGGTFQSFTERDIRVRTSLSRLEQLQIGEEALVFGRIDRGAEHREGPEVFHIGRLAISDANQEPLVVDWRAPVAEPFYRATGAHPMGLRLRRHFLTEGRRVLDLEDELLAGGDAGAAGADVSGPHVLLAALERSRSGRMRDIVATVQREQDEIIRAPLPGVLVVQGGPGTGKTAVALHRAAYLLYTHRFPLERQGVLVVGPNPTFLRYIEHVLPSLGESGVELTTVAGLFRGARPQRAEPAEAADVARLKGDARMAKLLRRAVGNRQRPLRRPVDIPYGRFVVRLTPAASAQIVQAAKRRPGPHNPRRRLVETLLWRHLQEDLRERAALALGAADPDAEGPSAADLGRQLRRRPDVAEILDRMWPLLSPKAFLHDLFGAQPLIDLAGGHLLSVEERRMLFRGRSENLDAVAWTQEDVPLLDEADALLGPTRRPTAGGTEEPRAYGHIVVDEAQDLSPMQLRMLTRRSLSGSMTVVGDIAQATGPWAASDWGQIVAHLPTPRGWRHTELTVNYRTPSEVMAYAGRVLEAVAPGMRSPESVRDTGVGVEIVAVAGGELTDAVVEAVRPAAPGTTAIIAPRTLLARLAARLDGAGLAHGRFGGDALGGPLSLLAVEEAKGLEFDSVVVVEPARLAGESPQGLRAVYVALTRATQRLAIVHAEALPEPLRVSGSDSVADQLGCDEKHRP
ncbi:MAG: HelD family protein [Acidimicrobiales bacterium]